MKYLLDTHTFIWLNGNAANLSTLVKRICADTDNDLFLSLASVWEMQIKLQIGKLRLPAELDEILTRQQELNRVALLPIKLPHILKLAQLPTRHRDPFDRMLVAQTIFENVVLISHDPLIRQYPVEVVW